MRLLLNSNSATWAVLFSLILTGGLVVFWPGLSGPFLFDDHSNLQSLGNNGGITDLKTLFAFVMSGESSTLGRPLSFLSFALNAQNWPAVPWPFKYTNLLIHLLNGVLVFILSRQLVRILGADWRQQQMIAILTMAIWVIHPLQISPMFQVVQRMTLLMGTFTLLGLIMYLHGRTLFETSNRKGYLWVSAGIGICGVLAVLSKENGILLPFYAIVLELTLFYSIKRIQPPRWLAWKSVFLYLPLIMLIGYIILSWNDMARVYEYRREFTLIERLLTESRVLADYVMRIFIPRLGGAGLYHDDYIVSKGLLTPYSTLATLLVWAALLISAWRLRARMPVISLAVLWFLAGHSLEGTVIPLELYFEHRNYLPMLGPIFALCWYATQAPPANMKKIAVMALSFLITINIFLSWSEAKTWSSREVLAQIWVMENPHSTRARLLAADSYFQNNDVIGAISQLEEVRKNDPRHAGALINLLTIKCNNDLLERHEISNAVKQLATSKYDTGIYKALGHLRESITEAKCTTITQADMLAIINVMLNNKYFTFLNRTRHYLSATQGQLYYIQGDIEAAIQALDNAYKARPNIDIAILQAVYLVSVARPDQAERYLDLAENTPVPLKDLPKKEQQLEKIRGLRKFIAEHRNEDKE